MTARQLEARMKTVLLALALTSSARTTSYNPSGSGGTPDWTLVDDRGRAKGGDAPHLYHQARWNAAVDDEQRAAAVDAAEDELDHIRRSHADLGALETREQLDARIIRDGAGWEASSVAIAMRTGITVVRKARKAAGLDLEHGLPLRNQPALGPDERRAEILRLHAEGLSPHHIATALGVPRSSIRYIVARATK